jgi:hypothetical protein
MSTCICENEQINVDVFTYIFIYMHIYKYLYICIHTARKERLIAEETDDFNKVALISGGPEVLPMDVGTGAKEVLMLYWTSLCVLRRTYRQSTLYETLFHCNTLSKPHHHHQEGQGDIYDVAYDERCMVMETTVSKGSLKGAREGSSNGIRPEGSSKGVGSEGSLKGARDGIRPEGPYVCDDPHAVCMVLENDNDLLGFGCEDMTKGGFL